jgi:hypothetical protein
VLGICVPIIASRSRGEWGSGRGGRIFRVRIGGANGRSNHVARQVEKREAQQERRGRERESSTFLEHVELYFTPRAED